jgi:hypothetical protein
VVEKWTIKVRREKDETLSLDTITCCTFPNKKKRMKRTACGPLVWPRPNAIKERGIVNRVAHVEVEAVAAIASAVGSIRVCSSARGGSVGSTLFLGGEFVFGKLAVDSVGELVECDCASDGVELEPVEWVCASFARLLV